MNEANRLLVEFELEFVSTDTGYDMRDICVFFNVGRSKSNSKLCFWWIALNGHFRICFAIAEICLLAASVRNAYHTKYVSSLMNEQITCKMLRRGVFGAGAAFIVFTCLTSELFYVSFSKAHDQTSSFAKDTGIRMANL